MTALHHVQIGCPPGGEDGVRPFWSALGLVEVDKPAPLADRGGAWFRAHDAMCEVTAEVHVGVERAFAPAERAHPALLVDDLDAVAAALMEAGFEPDHSQRDTFPNYRRFHVRDPHGNRVEVLQTARRGHDDGESG